MKGGHRVRLNNGVTIPVLGFGTYSYPFNRKATYEAIRTAIKMGYRHFDTAKVYGSEAVVGEALREAIEDGLIRREDVFVTSKLWCSDHHDPVSALELSLRSWTGYGLHLVICGGWVSDGEPNILTEYVDMYLVHWPVKLKPGADEPVPNEDEFEAELDMESTWAGMERCLELGMCRSIGVSNFSSKKIKNLLHFASVTPVVNQVEMHPKWKQKKLRQVCAENKIHVSAYSPLGAPGNMWGSTAVVDNPIIQAIALKYNASPAQVILQWGIARGSSVIPKSFNKGRMKENMGALDLVLDRQDLFAIDGLDESKFLRGEVYVNQTTSPYKSIEDLWDGEV